MYSAATLLVIANKYCSFETQCGNNFLVYRELDLVKNWSFFRSSIKYINLCLMQPQSNSPSLKKEAVLCATQESFWISFFF